MGFWDVVSKFSERASDDAARRFEQAADRAERQGGANLSAEQQRKIDHVRAEAQRGRDFAQRQRDIREMREEQG